MLYDKRKPQSYSPALGATSELKEDPDALWDVVEFDWIFTGIGWDWAL